MITNELLAINLVVVTSCFNNSAEVYNRLTSLAVGSAGITVLGTSSILISKSLEFCIVNVVGRRNGCEFGCNVDGAAEGVAVNNTVNNVNIDVYNRLVALYRHVLIRYIVVTIPSPNANRNAYESVIESLAAYAVLFNGYGKNLGDFVILKGCLEAVSNDCAFGFPSVGVVQLELSNELVYAYEICNVDVNVVDRLRLGSFAGVVMTAERDHCITCNGEGTGDLHGVAQFVLNLESNNVLTCAESNVALGGEHIAVDGRFYNNTINRDLTRGKVECSIICNSCGERNVVTVDNRTVIERNSGIRGGIGRIGNGRKHSIINSRAVVQSDIIDVEGNYISCIGFYISTNEGRRTAVSFVSCHGHTEIIVLRNVDSCVNPSGFGNICIASGVQVGLLTGCSRGEHKVILLACIRTVSVLYIELRLECETLACRGECILGNIEPHTKSSCLHSVSNVTKNDNLVRNIKENIVRPACKSSIGIVKSPCKCIVTISNFATICGGRNKGIATEVFVELTCKRSRTNEGVVYTVVLAPLLSFFKAHEASLITIFKVEEDFRTLTEFDGIS